jgi:zinc/manganese transport system substrate-binding protein
MLRTLALTAATALTMISSGAMAEPIKVVASFSIISDFAREVGGDRIALTTLVGPGGDAHVYEPKPADVAAMTEAQVVLVNGLHFEGFLERLVETSDTKAEVVELTKGVKALPVAEEHHEGEAAHEEGHDHGAVDPHAFQSIANAQIYVANVAAAFCAADPTGCDVYKRNALAYDTKLEALDADVTAAIAAIPADKRIIITSHDAFGYFEHAYGIRFLAPEGVSTDAEASAADVAALIKQVREDKAAAIFVENVSDPRLVEQIARETGLKVGGTLYSDALSEGAPAATYIDMMRHNVEIIRGAITGS